MDWISPRDPAIGSCPQFTENRLTTGSLIDQKFLRSQAGWTANLVVGSIRFPTQFMIFFIFCVGCAEQKEQYTNSRGKYTTPIEDRSELKVSGEKGPGLLCPQIQDLGTRLARIALAEPDYWIQCHAILAFGPEGYSTIELHPVRHQLFQAFLHGSESRTPFVIRDGRPFPRRDGSAANAEVHRDQYLHILAMIGVPLSATIRIEDSTFSVRQLLESSMHEAHASLELPWTISAFTTYGVPNFWENKFGERVSLEMLMEEIVRRPQDADAPCLATHYFFALSCIRAYSDGSFPLSAEVDTILDQELTKLVMSQRSDGAFVPDLSGFPENSRELFVLLYTGHHIEWLCGSQKALLAPESAERVIHYLETTCSKKCDDFEDRVAENKPLNRYEFSVVCHAVSALARYCAFRKFM